MTPLSRCLVLGLAAALFAPVASADPCAAPSTAPAMSESVYRLVEAAAEEINEGASGRAVTRLRETMGRLRGYERAVALQTVGYAYIQEDREAAALQTFQEALALEALPPEPQQQLHYNVAQLKIASGRTEDGVRAMERYLSLACETPPAHAHMLLATGYVELSRYTHALEQVRAAQAKRDEVPEEWLRFELGLHFELRDFREAADVLVRLLARSPRDERYWRQLVGVYHEDGRLQRALAASALQDRLGLSGEEGTLRNLAALYLAMDIPYKAGEVLQRGMEAGHLSRDGATYERTANAWIRAREWGRAEPALQSAAEATGRAELFLRLGQVRMERERNAEAVEAFRAALARDPEHPARIQYQMGIAAWRAGDATRAREALEQAARDPEQRAAARQWLDFIGEGGAG